MNYLIDTNALSELRRRNPHRRVVTWFSAQPPESLYLSVLTLGEIRKGIARLPPSERRKQLDDWLQQQLPAYFTGRILPIDAGVAEQWGQLCADAGRPLPSIDSLLAATALHHDLALVTRNTKDFPAGLIELINPWEMG